MTAGDPGTTPGGAIFNERYEVVAPISSGAMGAVYRAIDRDTDKEVAIKRLLDVRNAARFEIEARLLSSLNHPRVVKVIDHAGDDAGLYIVMELVRGTDLGAQLNQRGQPGLPPTEAIEYARHACEALQYVHDQQIVHRDVKPQNMILAENGVVLVDFGVARAIGSDETVGTIAVGTPRYMAPEVFAGGTVSAAQRHLQPRRHAVDADGRQPAEVRRHAQDRQGRPPAAARVARGAGRRPRDPARDADRVRARPSPRRSACRSQTAAASRWPRASAARPRTGVIEAIVRTGPACSRPPRARSP